MPNCDTILTKPINIDWREALGEDLEGYTVYEALDCEECGREVVCTNLGQDEHRYIEDTITLTEMPKDGEEFKCLHCNETITVKLDPDGGDYFDCPECGTNHAEGEKFANDCMGTLYPEGPMMNYWYPLPGFDGDPSEAACKIAHLPLCIVEFANGDFGLALTGGGMDLSWEICAAYLALDYMPPLHFCELPDMAGKHNESGWQDVVNACIESADTAKSWAERTMVRLDELRSKLQDDAA